MTTHTFSGIQVIFDENSGLATQVDPVEFSVFTTDDAVIEFTLGPTDGEFQTLILDDSDIQGFLVNGVLNESIDNATAGVGTVVTASGQTSVFALEDLDADPTGNVQMLFEIGGVPLPPLDTTAQLNAFLISDPLVTDTLLPPLAPNTPIPYDSLQNVVSTEDDVITGGNGFNDFAGGQGNDKLTGGNFQDILDGGDGNDTLNGKGGDDSLDGGGGDDTLSGKDGNDVLNAGKRNDLVEGGNGNDTATGGAGNDTLKGDGGNDLLQGGDNNDDLQGGAGDDTLEGGAGSDTLLGQNGNDLLKGGGKADELNGGDGVDTLEGGDGSDVLKGGKGNDVHKGGKGTDALNGGKGKDVVNGGKGNDTLTGGEGKDEFVFTSAQDGKDTVTDFEDGLDVLVMKKLDIKFNDLTIKKTDGGASTKITFDDLTIILEDVAKSDVDKGDFMF